MTKVGWSSGESPNHEPRRVGRVAGRHHRPTRGTRAHQPVGERGMRRIADIGAAVIGTGFIGTVHVEALRRIGVEVRGVLGSTPERGAARAETLGVPRAYDSLEALLDDPTVDVVHVTSPNDLHLPQAEAVLAAGRHVVCEKPLAMSAAESRELVGPRRGERAGQRRQLQHPLLPAEPARPRGRRPSGEIGDVRLVTGRYFQDWLLLETDWNWRLQPERGGALRAVGDIGSHWLDLTAFITGQRDRRGHGRARDVRRGPSRADRPGRDLLDRGRRRNDHARHRDRGLGVDPAPLRERRTRGGQHQPDQRRPQELAPVRDRRAPTRRSPGTRSSPTRCGSAIASGRTRS